MPNVYSNPMSFQVPQFIEIPSLKSVEEIEEFQKKMYNIYKNGMPQIYATMNQNIYYPQNSQTHYQYHYGQPQPPVYRNPNPIYDNSNYRAKGFVNQLNSHAQ
jgi:hypothetical protein